MTDAEVTAIVNDKKHPRRAEFDVVWSKDRTQMPYAGLDAFAERNNLEPKTCKPWPAGYIGTTQMYYYVGLRRKSSKSATA